MDGDVLATDGGDGAGVADADPKVSAGGGVAVEDRRQFVRVVLEEVVEHVLGEGLVVGEQQGHRVAGCDGSAGRLLAGCRFGNGRPGTDGRS